MPSKWALLLGAFELFIFRPHHKKREPQRTTENHRELHAYEYGAQGNANSNVNSRNTQAKHLDRFESSLRRHWRRKAFDALGSFKELKVEGGARLNCLVFCVCIMSYCNKVKRIFYANALFFKACFQHILISKYRVVQHVYSLLCR